MLPARQLPPDDHTGTPTPASAASRPATPRHDSLDEQKRSFLRMASHELRTPLNSILGFSEILATELYGPLGDPQYKEYAEIIRGSGQKLLKLVNQVLEIARLESGVVDFKPRAESVAVAVDDVVSAFVDDFARKDLRITVSGLSGVSVMADPRGLRAVLTNLVHNAISFSPQGGEIRIYGSAERELVEIVVANEGGVAACELPRLLRPFEQGENALTRHGEGAGLGLPICELTCQAMGGLLKLASAPGQGFSAHVILRGA